MQLTNEQQAVFDQVENSQANILVTGKPGVGKSVIIRELINKGQKKYFLAAPTGLAALNIGGQTLHSLFQIPTSQGIITEEYNNFTTFAPSLIKLNKIDHLIIDECSMIRADVFDFIDRLLRSVRKNPKPFGGVQIILFGDFYQLPPVVLPLERAQLERAGYKTAFLFSAKAFEDFEIFQLETVMRQKDGEFLDILDRIRTGHPTREQFATLNARHGHPHEDGVIKLMSTNKDADACNTLMLQALKKPIELFVASHWGEWPAYPCPERLSLAVGAQVMVKKNGADVDPEYKGGESKVVNGTIGTVTEINERYIVLDVNGDSVNIYKQNFTRSVKQNEDGTWKEVVVASFTQFPLILAWAISIHKSQGQTFDKCIVSTRRIFAPGQLYVALSRCKSLDGITLEERVLPSHFIINHEVNKFFETKKQVNGTYQ